MASKDQELYSKAALAGSETLTRMYSTSFTLGIRLFDKRIRPDIYAVYGLVRLADEIVDSFPNIDQAHYLDELEQQTDEAYRTGFSTNLVVQAYIETALKYNFEREWITAFFASMRMDLTQTSYDQSGYETYIYGSAEVIGLMCLAVFCQGDKSRIKHLTPSARALGSAFQKINFLRDLADDENTRGRIYFPGVRKGRLTQIQKEAIINDIKNNLLKARSGIRQLPKNGRTGVMLAEKYYGQLLVKLDKASVEEIYARRMRIPNGQKTLILLQVWLREHIIPN